MRMIDTGSGSGAVPPPRPGTDAPPPLRAPVSPVEVEAGGRRLLLSPGDGPVVFWSCLAAIGAGGPASGPAGPPNVTGGPAAGTPLAHRTPLLGPVDVWNLVGGWAAAVHPDDLERCLASFRDAFGGRRTFEVQYRLRRAGGGHGWVRDRGFPCFDPSGAFAGYFGTVTDITGLRRDLERERMLADIAAALDTSPSLTARLRLTGHVLVPEFADLCAIEPPPAGGGPGRPLVLGDSSRPAAESVDERAVQAWLEEAWQRAAPVPPPVPPSGAGAPRGGPGPSGGGPRVASAPLAAGGRVIGTLLLRRAASRAPFGAEDGAVVQELARRLGLHFDYARLLGIERAARAKVEHAAGRAARLQRLAAELSSALTADEVARVIAAHAQAATEIDAHVTVVGTRGGAGTGLHVMACTGPGHEPPEPGDGAPAPTGPCPHDDAAAGAGGAGLPVARPLPHALDRLLARPRPFWTGPPKEGAGVCPACPPPGGGGMAALLPISLLGEPVGALSVVLPSGREPGRAERRDLIAIAELGAQALGRARRFDLESRVAGSLQRSLLPDRLPSVPGVTARARYRPAAQDRLGGDWYDQVPVHDGRVAVAVGDVSGHGIGAAAVMSQVRAGLSAYLAEGHPPARALQLTSALTAALPAETMVTVCCAVVDPAAGTVEYANAGHPPPLVRSPGGGVAFLNAVLGPPLGIGETKAPAMTRVPFPAGSTLLLYTDGLVERRGESLDHGLERLARRLGGCSGPLDETADALLALTAPAAQDDVTILLLRTDPPQPAPPRAAAADRVATGRREAAVAVPGLALELTGDRAGLAALRERLRAWLAVAGAGDETVYEIVLACGEAAANAIEHGYGLEPGPLELRAALEGGTVRLALADRGRWRDPHVTDRGRGLLVMRELMDTVEVAPAPGGTVVTMTRGGLLRPPG
ncbi:SpoIIE family protein phosphatase [Spirillospora sp. CA-255316]